MQREPLNNVINVPVESLKNGQNKVKIEIDGRGRYTYPRKTQRLFSGGAEFGRD